MTESDDETSGIYVWLSSLDHRGRGRPSHYLGPFSLIYNRTTRTRGRITISPYILYKKIRQVLRARRASTCFLSSTSTSLPASLYCTFFKILHAFHLFAYHFEKARYVYVITLLSYVSLKRLPGTTSLFFVSPRCPPSQVAPDFN